MFLQTNENVGLAPAKIQIFITINYLGYSRQYNCKTNCLLVFHKKGFFNVKLECSFFLFSAYCMHHSFHDTIGMYIIIIGLYRQSGQPNVLCSGLVNHCGRFAIYEFQILNKIARKEFSRREKNWHLACDWHLQRL